MATLDISTPKTLTSWQINELGRLRHRYGHNRCSARLRRDGTLRVDLLNGTSRYAAAVLTWELDEHGRLLGPPLVHAPVLTPPIEDLDAFDAWALEIVHGRWRGCRAIADATGELIANVRMAMVRLKVVGVVEARHRPGTGAIEYRRVD